MGMTAFEHPKPMGRRLPRTMLAALLAVGLGSMLKEASAAPSVGPDTMIPSSVLFQQAYPQWKAGGGIMEQIRARLELLLNHTHCAPQSPRHQRPKQAARSGAPCANG